MLITHPRADLLVPAVKLYTEVRAGRFGVIADEDICGPFLRTDVDHSVIARGMNLLAAESKVVFIDSPIHAEMVSGDTLLISASRREVRDIAELYTRILDGQWDFAVSMLQTLGLRLDYDLGQALLHMRVVYNGGYYPVHPHASIGAAESVPAGRLGYLTWKMLGGGVPGPPTFSLDGQWPVVREIETV